MTTVTKKRGAPLTESFDGSKRHRGETQMEDDPSISKASPLQSPFFRLPRELRDPIYKDVLDTISTTFKHGRLTLHATVWFLNDTDTEEKGLPPWIRSNKQMCSEALEVLGRTGTFTAVHYDKRDPQFDHWPRPRAIFNPLVINKNVIQNIAVERESTLWSESSGVTGHFLRLLRSWQANDLCLKSSWRYCAPDLSWGGMGNDSSETWNSFWIGRFRKVTIRIMTNPIAEGGPQRWVELAEEYAKRLVGDESEVSWDPPEKGKVTPWFHYVVVERKI